MKAELMDSKKVEWLVALKAGWKAGLLVELAENLAE